MSDTSLPSPRLKTTIAAAEVPGLQGLLTLAVAVVAVAALYLAREVLVPIVLSVLLSFVLGPVVSLLRRTGLPRVPSVVSAVLLALGIVLLLGGVIGTQVAQLASEVPRYATTIERKVSAVRGYTLGRMTALTARVGRQMERAAVPAPAPAPANQVGQPPAPIPVEVHQPDPSPLEVAERVLAPVLGPLATMGIVFIVTVFVLMQKEDLRDRLIRLFGSGDLHRTTAAMDDAAGRLSKYFLTQLALNAAFGCVIAAGLFIIGVPNPILWGIIAALMRFVPYIGAIASAALPIGLAAAVDPGWTMVIETLALFLVVEPLTGQVVEPLIYGHSTGLSPVSVVISAIFWGWLWGPVGLILSMPLTLCLVVLGRHVERLEFIDVLLGDKPALTPAESFYQRMLAGDADEALDQAEILLRDNSLAWYYDDVALKGLLLAANDSLRGVLTEPQLQHIQDAVGSVITDLAEQKDPDTAAAKGDAASPAVPPVLDTDASVLCIAGRGPLDEAACAMLTQLLAHRGIRARVASTDAASRANIGALDVRGIRTVCVSYLEAGGSLSSLRYLMRRLRYRAPGATIMVGFWQAETADVPDERLRATIGADHYVTSLREAVDACPASLEPPIPAALVA